MARRQFLKNSHTHTHMGKRKHAPLHIQRLINFLLWDKNNEACAFLFESARMVTRNEKKNSSNNHGNCNLPVYHPLREFAIDPPQSTCKETISHIIIFLPVLWTNLYCCCHFIIIYWVTWLRSLLIWLRHGWKLHPKQMKLNPRTSYTFTHTIFDIALLSMLCFHHLLEQHNLNCGGVVWLQIDIFCWWLFFPHGYVAVYVYVDVKCMFVLFLHSNIMDCVIILFIVVSQPRIMQFCLGFVFCDSPSFSLFCSSLTTPKTAHIYYFAQNPQ